MIGAVTPEHEAEVITRIHKVGHPEELAGSGIFKNHLKFPEIRWINGDRGFVFLPGQTFQGFRDTIVTLSRTGFKDATLKRIVVCGI